jgi:hypothetical protein
VLLCKLCGEERELIAAHIIPRSFYEPLKDGSGPLRIGSNRRGFYPKRSPSGSYDTKLVCRNCEALFSPWDDYAQQLLLNPAVAPEVLKADGHPIAYVHRTFDYHRLKLFFVSLVWRASASNREFFSLINLGPFEETAKQMILSNNPKDSDTFGIALAKFEHPLGRVMLDPDRTKYVDINYCRLYFAGYIACIKVDKRPAPAILQDFQLAPGRPLVIILRDFKTSKELTLLGKLARSIDAQRKKQR